MDIQEEAERIMQECDNRAHLDLAIERLRLCAYELHKAKIDFEAAERHNIAGDWDKWLDRARTNFDSAHRALAQTEAVR